MPSRSHGRPLDVLRGLTGFLERCAPPAAERDYSVLAELRGELQALEAITPPAVPVAHALQGVRDLVEGIRIGASGPESGSRMCPRSVTAGRAGGHTFLLGMSDSAWSAGTRQDPVLLAASGSGWSANLRRPGGAGFAPAGGAARWAEGPPHAELPAAMIPSRARGRPCL